jgi:hypothetical protein
MTFGAEKVTKWTGAHFGSLTEPAFGPQARGAVRTWLRKDDPKFQIRTDVLYSKLFHLSLHMPSAASLLLSAS